MAKPMYVTVDPLLPVEEEGQTNLLVRKVDESYLSRTFRDLVQKVLDPEADEYNAAYNAQDKNIAAQVQGWFNEMNANPNAVKVDVAAITKDEPPQELRVGLNDVVSDYSDRILKQREEEDESGQKVPYNLIDLCVAKNVPGGIYVVLAQYEIKAPK